MSIKNKIITKIKERGGLLFKFAKESTKSVVERNEEVIADKSVDYIMEASGHIVNELRTEATPLIEQTANTLTESETDTWNILREKIAPSGGFFNTLFARLLWVGAKVSSFVTALVVDNWTGNNEKDKNAGNLDRIFSWMLGSMFKKDNSVAVPV